MFPSLLTLDEFRSRTIMPAEEVRRACGVQWRKGNDDAAAATATGETVFSRLTADATITDLAIVPRGPLVADPVNFATITLAKRSGAGAPVTLATFVTSALSWMANVEIPLPITLPSVSAGDSLTVAIAKSGTGVIVPAGELFVTLSPSFLETSIGDWSSEMISRLSKRYPAPTATKPWPAPITSVLKRWCTKLVTRAAYAKIGWSPTSEQDQASIEKAADDVDAKLKEAADGQNGLFELYLGEDGTVESVGRASPLSYAEQSPFTASRLQRDDGSSEDAITATGGRPS